MLRLGYTRIMCRQTELLIKKNHLSPNLLHLQPYSIMPSPHSHWKDSSSVILVAPKHQIDNHSMTSFGTDFKYKILMLKRSQKSKFMPNAYVFPGGCASESDFSDEWINIFKNHNYDLLQFNSENSTKNSLPMMSAIYNSKIPNDVAFRICAIRETFEESGVLLYRKVSNNTNSNLPTKNNLMEWAIEVNKDDTNFLKMFKTLNIVPDIWCLNIWSDWLTPTAIHKDLHAGRRYDTCFYLCVLNRPITEFIDNNEITSSEWYDPAVVLNEFYNEKLWLAPPQVYEISRLCNFNETEDLARFAVKRAREGCERFLPVRMDCSDGLLSILPGDDLYPENPDLYGDLPTLETSDSMEVSLQKAKSVNRMELRARYEFIARATNDTQSFGHVPPLSHNEIMKRVPHDYTSKL